MTGWQATASLCFYSVFAATAFIRETFGVSRTLVGVAVTAAMLGYTLLLFPAGALVDAFGERPTMVVGLGALGAAAVGVSQSPTFPVLLVALVVVGGAYATAMPASNRAALAVAPRGHRNLAVNVKQVGVTAGSGASALVVTTAATALGGWEVGFLVAAGLAVVVAVGFTIGYRGREGSGRLELPDVRSLLSLEGYRPLVAAGFFLGAAVFSTTAYVVLHLTEAVGVGAGFAGVVLASVQVTGSAGRLGGGAIADRLPGPDAVSSARVLAVQSALAGVLFGAVVLADTKWPAALAFAGLGVFMLGFPGIYYSSMTALVPDERVGAATAGGQTALNLGGLVGPPTFGYLADAASYDTGWVVLAGCAGAAALLVLPVALGRA